MSWLDLAIIITVIGGTFFGLWIGFVRAAFTSLVLQRRYGEKVGLSSLKW